MSIGSDGLMGDKVINIIQGSASQPAVVSGDRLISSKPFDTDKLMASLQRTIYNAEIVSLEISHITRKMNSKNGIIGRLIDDSTFSAKIAKTVKNLEIASGGLSQNMEAAKSSFLLKGYFKKKEKKKLEKEAAKEAEIEAEKEAEKADKKSKKNKE